MDAGLAYKHIQHVDKVGTHPWNREGQGLSVSDVVTLAETFARDGWNAELQDPLTFETPPGEQGTEFKQWNADKWADSDGLLRHTNPDELVELAVAGSHSTAALRALCGDTLLPLPKLCKNGVIDPQLVKSQSPSLVEPLETGIMYRGKLNR